MDTSVPIPEKQQSFIQSWASLRRPRQQSSIAWNIYALEKKSVIDMFKQFCESAESLGQGIPPVLQHHLSEAHILLRPLVRPIYAHVCDLFAVGHSEWVY
jgi:hypothetical protein